MASAPTIQIKPGKLFIGGKWVDAASGKTFATTNPATGETLTMLAEAGEADADAAVAAARCCIHFGSVGGNGRRRPRENPLENWRSR